MFALQSENAKYFTAAPPLLFRFCRAHRPAFPAAVTPLPVKTHRTLSPVLAATCVVAGTTIAYAPALRGAFLWNDSDYVTAPALRSLHGLWRIWFELGATQQYYPVLHSAFWIEHALWGDSALGYHLANVALHATAACLFALILLRLERVGPAAGLAPSRRPSFRMWFAAAIFALHPVCVESVAWISEQKNTLSTVFYLLAGLTYLRFEAGCRPPGSEALGSDKSRHSVSGSSSRPTYVLATAFFLLALLTKSVTATLPAALLVALWWRRGRLSWQGDILPLIPWLGLGAASGLFTAWVERTYLGAQGAEFALNGVQRCLVAGRAVWFYVGKIVWPVHLTFIYPRWTVDTATGWQYLFPLGALGLTWTLWHFRRRTRGPLAAWLFFVGSLFPTLGFLNVYAFIFSYVADHWEYLASLGIIAPAAAAGDWIASLFRSETRSLRSLGGGGRPDFAGGHRAAAAAVLCVLGVLTWRQCGMYRDAETLYRVTLDKNPNAWMAHNNLGNILREQNRFQEAEPHYRRTLQLEPSFLPAYTNLGNTLFPLGHLPEARDQFTRALQLDPGSAEARTGLGSVLFQLGRTAEGLAQLAEAAQRAPDFAKARYNYGNALLQADRTEEAARELGAAVRLDPDHALAHTNLAIALDRLGRIPEAAAQFEWALRLRPDAAEAHNNYGNVLAQLGRTEEAKSSVYRGAPDRSRLWGRAQQPPNVSPGVPRAVSEKPQPLVEIIDLRCQFRIRGSWSTPSHGACGYA